MTRGPGTLSWPSVRRWPVCWTICQEVASLLDHVSGGGQSAGPCVSNGLSSPEENCVTSQELDLKMKKKKERKHVLKSPETRAKEPGNT